MYLLFISINELSFFRSYISEEVPEVSVTVYDNTEFFNTCFLIPTRIWNEKNRRDIKYISVRRNLECQEERERMVHTCME